MELDDTFASAAGGAKEGSAKKKFGVAAAAVLALIVVVIIFSAGGAEEEEAAEADGVALMGAAAAVDCSNPTAQAVLQSCGASLAWDVGSGQYAVQRSQALAADGADMVGSKISLTEREQAADSLLRAARAVDLTDSPPLPSVHFFHAKPRYDASTVLPIIRAVSASVAALNGHSCWLQRAGCLPAPPSLMVVSGILLTARCCGSTRIIAAQGRSTARSPHFDGSSRLAYRADDVRPELLYLWRH
eukprot:COSAG06_NODE_20612_length_788_cov_1.008708_1_plen_244_part_10